MNKRSKAALLPARLRGLRIERGLSARALGEAVGVSDRQIYRYEWGVSAPTKQTVERLARHFGKSPQWLMGWA